MYVYIHIHIYIQLPRAWGRAVRLISYLLSLISYLRAAS